MNDVVFLVDTDAALRGALSRRLEALGYTVEAFESADQLLRRAAPCPDPCCVVVDVDLQAQLAAADPPLSIVFLAGDADVPTSVAAMKAGAVDLLTKPVDDADLLDAIERALARDAIRVRVGRLTPRERDVFARVVTGMLNKQIAAELALSEKTVKVHRARVMRKLEAGSLAELVRMADRIGVGAARG